MRKIRIALIAAATLFTMAACTEKEDGKADNAAADTNQRQQPEEVDTTSGSTSHKCASQSETAQYPL